MRHVPSNASSRRRRGGRRSRGAAPRDAERGEEGPLLELVIERLAAGGEGVGREPGGRVVFVPQTAPGDRVRVRRVESRRRFARARVVELLEPGAGRVEPPCPVFGVCGGCSWQHLDAATQLEAKAAILRDAWVRVGRLADPGPVTVEPSPLPYGWRSRARVHVRAGRLGYRRAGSHEICATDCCPVLVPDLEAELAARVARPPADGELELAVGDGGSSEEPGVVLRAGPDRLQASPGVFFQANALLRGRLEEAVAEAAGEGDAALELFAGIGFFTVRLARRFARLVAVEGELRAVADLRANLARAGRTEVRVVEDAVERALAAALRAAEAPEVVVLDPPRTGLAPAAREALAELGARRIVYVSCDPATLARDASALVRVGYALRSLRGFDLFPQTAHVEALAVLERGPRAQKV